MNLLAFLADVTPPGDVITTNPLLAIILTNAITVTGGILFNFYMRVKSSKVINDRVDGVDGKVDGVVKTIASQDETIANLNARINELTVDNTDIKLERDNATKMNGQMEARLTECQRQIARLEDLHVVTTAQLKDVTDKRTGEIEAALGVAQKLVISNEARVGLEHRIIVLENTVSNNSTIAEIVKGIQSGIQTIANNPAPIVLAAPPPADLPAAGESGAAA